MVPWKQNKITTAAILLATLPYYCLSFAIVSSSIRRIQNPTVQSSVTKSRGIDWQSSHVSATQIAILDGAALSCLESFLWLEEHPTNQQRKTKENGGMARLEIVTGTNDRGNRVVGISASTSTTEEMELIEGTDGQQTSVYKDSTATIPQSISDDDAISTCVASLVGIHCAIHDPDTILRDVGGSSDNFVVAPKHKEKTIAILGGGDLACFLADGLSVIGATVSQITTSNVKLRSTAPNVSILPPAVGTMELGFAAAIGTFDCLVDTLANEATSVISLLKQEHGCDRYVSTISKSQMIIQADGLLFGKNKADAHSTQATSKTFPTIRPPKQFGSVTLQPLLEAGILFQRRKRQQQQDAGWVQGWSLKDFWEYSSWPRDSSSGAGVRFGLPVADELEIDEYEEEEDEPVMTTTTGSTKQFLPKDIYEGQTNPYVLDIKGLDELEQTIVSPEKDCLLFLSARYCRTCKYLNPQYTRLARQIMERDSDDILIATADAGKERGKAIGNFLEIDAVPAFVLFRDGKVFGDTLSISKLPSKKLNMALDLLSSGKEWDRVALRELDK